MTDLHLGTGPTAGVLVLKNNRTYGRYKNNPKNKLLYKCVPDDRDAPTVLVPYEMKHIGFSKSFTNLYVTFHIESTNDDSKGHPSKAMLPHEPIAKLASTIGPVDVLAHYYEYQLAAHRLTEPISGFTRATNQALRQGAVSTDISAITNTPRIFTIDPGGSTDFDDAVSIETLDAAEGRTAHRITIHIADVPALLTRLDLWEHVSDRVATVYLPSDAEQTKKPMLPPVLSDDLCSLVADKDRPTLALELTIIDSEIVGTVFKRARVSVARNYQYEERALLRDPDYINLLSVVRNMRAMPDQQYVESIGDSHDVVAYLMILMNCVAARTLRAAGTGIFRAAPGAETDAKDEIDNPVAAQFFRSGGAARYLDLESIPIENQDAALRHAALNVDAYVHITSPIRRLADLLNMARLQQRLCLITAETESHQSDAFYAKWIIRLDHINERMTAIRKTQNDCALVAAVAHDPDALTKEWVGYVCDTCDDRSRFSVFIPELKLVAKTRAAFDPDASDMKPLAPPPLRAKVQCRIHLFQDEDRVRRKVRVSVLQ